MQVWLVGLKIKLFSLIGEDIALSLNWPEWKSNSLILLKWRYRTQFKPARMEIKFLNSFLGEDAVLPQVWKVEALHQAGGKLWRLEIGK